MRTSTVVGYNNDETVVGTDAGMMTSAFATVAEGKGFDLSTLSVTGYDKAYGWDDDWKEFEGGGCSPYSFSMQQLDGNGRTIQDGTVYWIDMDDGLGHCQYKAGWYKYNMEDAVFEPLDVTEVSKKDCECFWVFGAGLSLVSSGAVVDSDIHFTTAAGTDASGFANGTAMDLTLEKVTISGYDPAYGWDDDWKEFEGGGCSPYSFSMQQLDGNGRTLDANTVYWIDMDDGLGHCQYKAGWYKYNNETTAFDSIDPTTVSVESGNGWWVFGNGLTINVPCYKSTIVD